MKNFTAKQKEIIARKLGYDGPMQGFDEFVQSSPALAMKYEMINDKYTERMNKGGAVMRYQAGGSVEQLRSTFDTSIFSKTPQEKATYYNSLLDSGYDDETIRTAIGAPQDQNWSALTNMASQQRAAAASQQRAAAASSSSSSVKPSSLGTLTENQAIQMLDTAWGGRSLVDSSSAPSSDTDGMVDMAVVVYGPDGTMYSSPSAARAAGVTNYTTTPPSVTITQSPVEKLRSSFDQSIFSKTPQEKAAYYNSLLDAGYDDATIRAAINAPEDQNWAQLRDIAQNLRTGGAGGGGGGTPATQSAVDRLRASFDQSIFNKTPAQKAEYYNSLLAAGYDDATIREAIGAPADQNWSRLQRLAGLRKSFDTSIFSKTPQEKAAYYNSLLAAGYDDATIREAIDAPLDANWSELQRIATGLRSTGGGTTTGGGTGTTTTTRNTTTTGGGGTGTTTTGGGGGTGTGTVTGTQYGEGGRPLMGGATTVTAAQTAITDDMKLDSAKYALTGDARQAQQTLAVAGSPVAAPPAVVPQSVTAVTAKPAVEQAMLGVVPSTGTAQTIQAAQLTEQQKQAAMAQAQQLDKAQQAQLATRTLQEGELVSGTAVDMRRAEEAIAKTQAAQGVVTEDMTVQGQLTKLTANFDASNPPPWAAGAIRSVTAQLAARGLGASSMAGQAIVQAALEMATPIASADAAAYQQMAAQNLSNRQQVAMLSAQQRAQFLGQEFDQTFQTRVLNAAKIADIANMNFTAQQQVYLENARLAQSVDLANLNNRQATVIANAATLAGMEMANLSARQQTAVANAQNFLQMEIANMSNTQQAALFKAQQLSQAALTDAAAENAARQFNASNKQQADQFNAGLATQVNQFNTAQYNAMQQFNAGQTNAISKFNAEMQEQRQQFNARNRIIIDQANAQLIANISTANTAAINGANFQNAQAMNNMTLAQYNNEVQLYRDQVKMVFDSYERAEDRAASMATAVLQAELAREKISAETSASYGKLLGSIVGTKVGEKVLDGAWDFVKNLFTPTGG